MDESDSYYSEYGFEEVVSDQDFSVNPTYKEYYPNGVLKEIGRYTPKKARIGSHISFDEDGTYDEIVRYSTDRKKVGAHLIFYTNSTSSSLYDASGLPHGVFYHRVYVGRGIIRTIRTDLVHGVPRRWVSVWWGQAHVHWIHAKGFHIILRYLRTRKEANFDVKLYKSSANQDGMYIMYENDRILVDFTVVDPHNKDAFEPGDVTKIYVEHVESWGNIAMKHGPFTDEYMADDILSTIEEEGDVRAGLDRYLTNYGVAPKFGSYQIREFIHSFLVQREPNA